MIILKIAITIVQLLCCLTLIAIVILQSGKSSGLSGAIGGGSDSYLAKNKGKTLDAKLSRLTKWVAIAFVVLTILLHII